MKIKLLVLVLLVLAVLGTTIFVVSQNQTSNQQNNSVPSSPTNTTEPTYSGSKTNASEELQDCIHQASIKDSPQNLIDEAIQACYDKYR